MRRIVEILVFVYAFSAHFEETNCAIDEKTQAKINEANKSGPYIGLVVPNLYELNLFTQSPSFTSTNLTIEFAGKRFRFGKIEGKNVVIVMTGLSMLNAGVTTQLLVIIFNITGVVSYGIANNANPSLQPGDIAIPKEWAHHALWNWQRYGFGPEAELPLEKNGDYTRDIGFLKFGDYANPSAKTTCNNGQKPSNDNLLNNIWFQPKEVFPVDGKPEERQHDFWVPVDPNYYEIAKSLQIMKLKRCINATTCLSAPPKVTTVDRGTTASIYLDNAAYRTFIFDKFKVTPVDMESAAVALVCYQQRIPFIIFRALSTLAGGGDKIDNADTFNSVVAGNTADVVVEFIKKLP